MSDPAQRLILCIDDDPDALNLLQYLLKRGAYEVIAAGDGRQGIRLARERLPDIILLDIEMPAMNGYEVCLQLQRDPLTAYIPVVFLTVRKGEPDRLKAIAAGGADFISKPFQLDPLLETIRHQLDRTARWQHLKAPLEAQAAAPQSLFDEFKKDISRRYDFSPDRHARWMQTPLQQLYLKAFDFGFSHDELARSIAEFMDMPWFQSIRPDSVRLGVLPLAFSKEHHILAVEAASAGVSFILSNPFDETVLRAMKKCSSDIFILYGVAAPAAIDGLLEQAPGKTGGGNNLPPGAKRPDAAAARDPRSMPSGTPGTNQREAQETGAASGRPRILVVDDDPESQRLVQHFLSGEPYSVTAIGDSMKALKMLEQRRFDLIISDVAMPKLDGLTLLSLLRERNLDTPVLLISGREAPENELRGLQLGAEDFLRKPLKKEILLLKIRKVLPGRANS